MICQIQYYRDHQMKYWITQLCVHMLYSVTGVIWYGQVEHIGGVLI